MTVIQAGAKTGTAILKWEGKDEGFKGIMEYWNDGRMDREEEDRIQETEDRINGRSVGIVKVVQNVQTVEEWEKTEGRGQNENAGIME